MKKILVAVIFTALCAYSAVTTFEKTFGGDRDDIANSIKQTSDGGYIVAGCRTDSVVADTYTQIYTLMTLKKIDSFGVSEWEKTAAGYPVEYLRNEGNCAIETNDGGYAVAGCIVGLNHFLHTLIYVLKTDSLGEKLWDYHYGYDSSVSSVAYDMIQTEDNGYAIVGENWGGMALVKLDAEGQEEWVNYTLPRGQLRSVIQTEDKGYALTGYTIGESEEETVTLIKTDSLGNEQWNKKYYGLFSYTNSYSLKQTPDKGFALFGMTEQMTYGALAWLIKTDENGELEWDLKYGGYGNQGIDVIGRSMDITTDGDYILAGYSEDWWDGPSDAWLIKTDAEGNIIWEKTYGREGDDRFHSVIQTTDGGFIMTGYTDSFGYGGKDMWIIKTDENGTEIESPFLPKTTELFQNYPNPFNPVTSISYALSQGGQVELSVYNLNGQLIKQLVDGKKEKGAHKVEFNAGDLTSGLYICSLKIDGKTVQSRKMMLLK
jgi:hypothetical protein